MRYTDDLKIRRGSRSSEGLAPHNKKSCDDCFRLIREQGGSTTYGYLRENISHVDVAPSRTTAMVGQDKSNRAILGHLIRGKYLMIVS